MGQEVKENFIQVFVKSYLPLLMVILGAAITWGAFMSRQSALEQRVTAVEVKANAIDSVQGDLKGINAKLDIILKKVQL